MIYLDKKKYVIYCVIKKLTLVSLWDNVPFNLVTITVIASRCMITNESESW